MLGGPFAPVLPEFDRFLFAAVGEEVDGMPLSVLSALSRLGLDPRGEAGRLSHLASEAAADQLARTIARLPDCRWTTSEVRRIAGGLVELLPPAKSGRDDAVSGSADRNTTPRLSPFLMYLTLVGAMLIGFFALCALSPDAHQQTVQTVQPASQTDRPISRD